MKMKKLIALLIAASVCVMMIGCSGKVETASDPADDPDIAPATEVQDELVPDDTGGVEFVAEESNGSNLCITGGEYLFNGYTYITNEYDETDGSYYDEYVSEDGIQAIYEKGVMNYDTDIAMEDYMLEEATNLAKGAGVMNATLEESSYSNGVSYPAYVAKFYSGSNEDTRSWIVYVVDTGKDILMYGLSCSVDYEEDMMYDAEDVFTKFSVEDNYRGLPVDESGLVETIDLMDFMGSSIEDVCAAIPGLEQDGEQYSAKEEKSMDGISLAGPFVSVDANGVVTGITYSGETYSLETLWVGTSMEYSGQYLKDLGWEFQSVDFANGTAQYVVTYAKDNMEIVLVSDTEGDFEKSEESDVTGCIATISVTSK